MTSGLKVLASAGMVGTVLGLYWILWDAATLPILSWVFVGLTAAIFGFVIFEIWYKPRVGISLNVLALAVVLGLAIISTSDAGSDRTTSFLPGGAVLVVGWLVGVYPILFRRTKSSA